LEVPHDPSGSLPGPCTQIKVDVAEMRQHEHAAIIAPAG